MHSPRARIVVPTLAAFALLVAGCAGRARERSEAPDGVTWCSVEDEAAGRCVARLMPEPVFTAPAGAAGFTATAASR